MNIAIEALGIRGFGGGRSATLNLLIPLLRMDINNHYRIFLNFPEPALENISGNAEQIVIPIKNRLVLRLWAQLGLPLLTYKEDLVHFVKNMGIISPRRPYVVTMYDMTTILHPELYPLFDVWYWKTIQRITLKNADRVICISQNTAKDVQSYYQISDKQVSVIYPAISDKFHPVTGNEVKRVRQTYGLHDEYFIHVGRLDKKKNLTTLVKALSLINGFTGCLALVGEEYLKSRDEDLIPTIQKLGLTERVVFTGPVPDNDLVPLYSGAVAAVFPSHHEGFGLAPLEALACGTPLIAYKAGAVAEVIGDSGIILDDNQPESFSKAMNLILGDPDLRGKMVRRGLLKAQQYSQDSTARNTLRVYEEIYSHYKSK